MTPGSDNAGQQDHISNSAASSAQTTAGVLALDVPAVAYDPAGDAEGKPHDPAGPVLSLRVAGLPAPQGSKQGFVNRHTGRVAMVESSKRVKPWREAVKHAALDTVGGRERTGDPFTLLDEPLFIYTVYTFIRPQTHYRTGRNAHLLRDAAPTHPTSRNKNDLEKLDRATRDALTDAGIWTDDSLVVHHDSWKVWAREHVDALSHAGAVIRIYRIGGSAC